VDGSASVVTALSVQRRDTSAKSPLNAHVVTGQVEVAAISVSSPFHKHLVTRTA
jgi:hypothetical protein